MKIKKNYVLMLLMIFIILGVVNASSLSLIRIDLISFKMFILITLFIILANSVTIKYRINITNYIVNSIYPFIIILSIFIFINTFFITITRVVGDSMLPNLEENQLLFLSYKQSYKRFDIIILEKDEELMVKRIIGLPNENVRILNNNIFINGEKININYDTKGTNEKDIDITLKDDEYFVLGDNLSNSYDSRYYDSVNKNEIKAVVLFK